MTYLKRRTDYYIQRRNAKRRGIPWLFNYNKWWRMWCNSGKWLRRGKLSEEYCMSRFSDIGPYAPWNVRIIKNKQNHYERNINMKWSEETRKKMYIVLHDPIINARRAAKLRGNNHRQGKTPWNKGKKEVTLD